MDIQDAASYFDDDPVYDAYTGQFLFMCHTTPHDDHTSSGATARRRTMTAIDSTLAPARHAVLLYGDAWIVGNSNPDGFQGAQIRRSFGLKKSTGLMHKLTPAEACLGTAGTVFHAHKEYYRDNQDPKSSAEWDTMWNIFCPPSEAIAKGCFLRQGSSLFRVRNSYPSIEELDVAEADQLDADALQDVTFIASTLNLVTDKMAVTSVATKAIQTDVAKFYRFRTLAESDWQPGDRTVFVAKSAVTPKVGNDLSMLGSIWRVLTVASELDGWAIQVRLA